MKRARKLIGVRLPKSIVKRLKMHSVVTGVSMQHIITLAIKNHLARAKT